MAEMKNAVHSVSTRVLQDWAMMLVDDAQGTQIFESDEPFFLGSIEFRGPFCGTLAIVAQKPFAAALSCNLLGMDFDGSLSDSECKDALSEMVNVVTGNFLTEAYGEDLTFDVIQPDVRKVPFEHIATLRDDQRVVFFTADDYPVAVTFWLDEK